MHYIQIEHNDTLGKVYKIILMNAQDISSKIMMSYWWKVYANFKCKVVLNKDQLQKQNQFCEIAIFNAKNWQNGGSINSLFII